MKGKNKLKIFDWVFVILNISFYLSIIKVFTFDLIPIPPIITLFFFNLFAFILRWKGDLSFVSELRSSILLILLFLIYLFDIVQNVFINSESAISRFFTMFSMFFLCSYLFNLTEKQKTCVENVSVIVKPYLLYGSYNVIIIIMAGLLIAIGVLSPTSNMLSVNSLTKVDVGSGQVYYFPGYISIVTESFRLFANWGIPMITGLSHEPHVVDYIVLPSLFFLLCFKKMQKWKLYIFIAFVIELFFAFSTTAISCLGIVLIINVFWSFSVGRDSKSLLPVVLVVLVVIFGLNGTFYNLIVDEYTRKTVVATSSMEYSSGMLHYLTHPQSVFGSGNMPGSVGNIRDKDVGAITFLLDLSFYIILLFKILKIVTRKEKTVHYIGLACLYVALHSLKISFLVFNYPYFIFVVFIVSYMGKRLKYLNRQKYFL